MNFYRKLPVDLQLLLQKIKEEAADFKDRQNDLMALDSRIQEGDFDMARYKAEDIIKRQRQIKQALQQGLPQDLQDMIQTIKEEVTDFKGRQNDLMALDSRIQEGDFGMARYKAEDIIKRQRQIRQALQQGLPQDLQGMIKTIKDEATDFKGRQYDLTALDSRIQEGDFGMARYKAADIIKRQRELSLGDDETSRPLY